MTLHPVEGLPGPPWERELRGELIKLTVESEILAGNPLGDPARRPLFVYLPPTARSGEARFPAIYLLQGYTGQLDKWLNREAFEPTIPERADELFSREDVTPAVLVFIDAWTSVGGSQFINSAATGRYMDYLCDEIVPFVDVNFPVLTDRRHRGVAGHSSGGYGALVTAMLRPDVFGALASHAGDALFEYSLLPAIARTARVLRDRFEGSYDLFWKTFNEDEVRTFDVFGDALMIYAMAACYSPDEQRPGEVELPFEAETGRLIESVWQRWLDWDPVRMAARYAEALGSMELIYLDAGKGDEYFADLGAQALSRELTKLGVEHRLELFDGRHGGNQHRYPRAWKALAEALAG